MYSTPDTSNKTNKVRWHNNGDLLISNNLVGGPNIRLNADGSAEFGTNSINLNSNGYNIYAASTAPNFFAGRIILGTSNTAYWQRPSTQNTGINLLNNSLTANTSALEITSNNNTNNNQRTAILFTKADKDKANVDADFLATAGSIEITDGFGATAGLIYNCGATTAANGFVSSSDYRLKENFASLDNAADRVKLLQPKRFNYIGDAETVDGFIAHEMEAACPAAVFGAKDATEAIGTLRDALGNVIQENVTEPSAEEMTYEEQELVTPYVAADPENDIEEQEAVYETVTKQRTWEATGTRPVYQGVDQSKLIPLLTKALQEALERIEQLEAKLA